MIATLASGSRFLHLSALALLLGSFAFALLIARPAFRKAGAETRADFKSFDSRLLRLAWGSLAAALISGLLMLWLQAATVTGRALSSAFTAEAIVPVLTGTQYGIVWITRLILMASLALLLRIERRRQESVDAFGRRYLGMALSALLIMALAFAGHAAAGEGEALFIQVTADALHLLATGIWLGGLVSLAMLFSWARKSGNPPARIVAQEAARRFSLLGLVSVSILLLTGYLNAWNLVGGIAPLTGTRYGLLLITKLFVVLLLMVIAAMNLLRLKPELLAQSRQTFSGGFKALISRLKRNVAAEAALGAIILVIVGVMGVTPPARHIQPEWPFSFRWSWVVVKNNAGLRSQVIVGSSMATLGLLFLGLALLRRKERYWAIGVGLTSLGYGSAVALLALPIDAYPTTYRRPAVPYHAISIANGMLLYRDSCQVCHGVAGYGDGPAAKDLKPKPANLTAKHTGDHTAGDLFWWLTHGIKGSAMPGFSQALSDEERWDLINFARTLGSAEQGRSMAPLVEPGPWLVAPDFVYRTEKTESKNLKEHRGEKIVLLALFTLPYSQGRLQQLDQLYEKLVSAGVEVLAVPRDVPLAGSQIGQQFRSLPVVIDGSQEIFATYALFRRSFTEEGTLPDPPIPRHAEFLIDRQGYVRARWIPGNGGGWAKVEALLNEIDRLNKEIPSAAAPDEHVH